MPCRYQGHFTTTNHSRHSRQPNNVLHVSVQTNAATAPSQTTTAACATYKISNCQFLLQLAVVLCKLLCLLVISTTLGGLGQHQHAAGGTLAQTRGTQLLQQQQQGRGRQAATAAQMLSNGTHLQIQSTLLSHQTKGRPQMLATCNTRRIEIYASASATVATSTTTTLKQDIPLLQPLPGNASPQKLPLVPHHTAAAAPRLPVAAHLFARHEDVGDFGLLTHNGYVGDHINRGDVTSQDADAARADTSTHHQQPCTVSQQVLHWTVWQHVCLHNG